MRPWWERWPQRLEEERRAFERRGLRFRLDEEDLRKGKAVFRGRARIGESQETDLIVVYPDAFPFTKYEIVAPLLDLERHQNPFGKNLCVIPRGSRHWDFTAPDSFAADVIADRLQKAVRLGSSPSPGAPGEEVPQGEPFSEYYHYWPLGAVLVPSGALELPNSKKYGEFDIRLQGDLGWLAALFSSAVPTPSPTGRALLAEVRASSREVLARADERLIAGSGPVVWTGRWFRFDPPVAGEAGPEFFTALKERAIEARALDFSLHSSGHRFAVTGVVFQEEVRQGQYEDAWVFLVFGQENSGRQERSKPALLRGMRSDLRDFGDRIPELAQLRTKKVALIGLGSLGSPVAHDLARGLVGELRLLDYDHVDAGATVRWARGLSSAGPKKVYELQAAFGRDYPYTRVLPFDRPVGNALSPPGEEGRVLGAWLSGADLMIDATAEVNISYALAYLAQELKIPQVYLWSVDGFGGVVARLVPGKTGCQHCLRTALSSGAIKPPPAAREGLRSPIQPRGCGDPTFTAAGIDLVPLATEATRMAIGVLTENSEGGYPAYPDDVLVWSLREPDGSLCHPQHWASHRLPFRDDCPLCAIARQ